MKKTLISSLILAALVFPVAAPVAQAQTLTVEQQIASIQAQLNQLIELLKLVQMIESLQAQLSTLSSQQTTTAQAISEVSSKVNTVVENTTPVVGSAAPSQPSVTAADFTLAIEVGNCRVTPLISEGVYTRGVFKVGSSEVFWYYPSAPTSVSSLDGIYDYSIVLHHNGSYAATDSGQVTVECE